MTPAIVDQKFSELVNGEGDVFRLAIRGHVEISAAIDRGINGAFQGGTPKELLRLPFERRLALALGLGVLAPTLREPLMTLSKLRNDFAHGKIDDLSPARADELADSLHVFFKDDGLIKQLKTGEPLVQLRSVLVGLHVAVDRSIRAAATLREFKDEALERQLRDNGVRAALMARLESGSRGASEGSQEGRSA